MTRYVRLLMSLAALAVVYWQLGGFQPPIPGNLTETPVVAPDSTDAAEDTLAQNGYGGPDDGLAAAELTTPTPGLLRTIDRLPAEDPAEAGRAWDTVTIDRNESLYVALQRAGLEHETIMALVRATEQHKDLRKVRRGDRFDLLRDPINGQLEAMRFDVGPERYAIVQRGIASDVFETRLHEYPIRRVVRAVRGEIRTSLFDALQDAGAPIPLADQIAEILGWEIDFFRDLRRDDSFVLVYAEYLHDGEAVRDPEVLAVHFVNDDQEIRAYRSENEHGLPAYYKADGASLERQFLRAPLKFTRISSSFSTRRLHPVLKRYRPHYGVDYAAPTGTPVMATADGVVIERSRDDASGNFVGLRHGNGFESYYLHLSRFAGSARKGARVRQGDVIGYVGATGWATGPHLDYRIKKSGKWIDPRRLSLPPADPVSDEARAAFDSLVTQYDTMIASVPAEASTLVLESTPASATATR